MLQFHCDMLRTDDINTFNVSSVCEVHERWAEGSVPGAVISGAVSAGKLDSQMAALSVPEVEGSGRRPVAASSVALKWTAWRY